MNPDTFYTALAAWGTWATVGSAAVVLILQNRTAKHLTCLQLFLQLASQYDSEDMNSRRARLSSKLLADPNSLEIDDGILVFFENVVIMVHQNLLNRDLSYNTFGIDVMSYWSALKHYILHCRQEFNDKSFYDEFEWLNNYMHEYSARLGLAESRVGIDRPAIERFLRMEMLRSSEPMR